MAKVSISKISLVGLENEKTPILKYLMNEGFVQIDDSAHLCDREEFSGVLCSDNADSKVVAVNEKIAACKRAIDEITPFAVTKKSMFAPKNAFKMLGESSAEEISLKIVEFNDTLKDIFDAKQVVNTLENSKQLLNNWVSFDAPLENLETKFTKSVVGLLDNSSSVDVLMKEFSKQKIDVVIKSIKTDEKFNYIFATSHKSDFVACTDILKQNSFSDVVFNEKTGTISENIKKYEDDILATEKIVKEKEDKKLTYASSLSDFENLFDYLSILKEELEMHKKLVKTRSTFILNGFLASNDAEKLKSELTSKFDCTVDVEVAKEDEAQPTLLANGEIVTPFEDITNMYSVPSVIDVDPNPLLAFFYVLFFGIMIGDIGYGLLFAGFCGFFIKKLGLKKGEGNLLKLLMYCGYSSILWGLIFGSFFAYSYGVSLMNPLEDVMILMGMSLGLGIVHLFVGLGVKGATLIKKGKVMDAVFDVGLWYCFVLGFVISILPVIGLEIGTLGTVGNGLACVGALGLVCTQGRSFEGFGTKIFKGVSSLYGIVGYFGDILSYSRIMALCLSGAVIGQVVNILAGLGGPFFGIFIAIIGHTINVLLSGLGAYVHTSRLQFVEFFGKFYEGGGEKFAPFKVNLKYTTLNNKEME